MKINGKQCNLKIIYFLIVFILSLAGFYLLEHFMPKPDENSIQTSIGDLKITAELFWSAISFFFLFRFMPSIIKWNAYLWGGTIIIISALIIMTAETSELNFLNLTKPILNQIESCFVIIIGSFFMIKGYLAYE
jgi:uncharacterized protein (DUF486 family)